MNGPVGWTASGHGRRLRRLVVRDPGRIVAVPLDDSLLSGPTLGLERLGEKLSSILEGGPDFIMGFPGLFVRYPQVTATWPAVLNLTASTTRSTHTRKVAVASVEDALKLGVDGVAVHVNITSQFENEMLAILGQVASDARSYGMPVMAIMYPRREGPDGDDNYDDLRASRNDEYVALVAHAVRVGVELGADIIKTKFTGSVEGFGRVIDAAEGVPVLIAGGPPQEAGLMYEIAYEAIRAGGSGTSFGRNTFSRREPAGFIKGLKAIVHDGATPKAALASLERAAGGIT